MQTLNSSSYSWTIFCWKASGRGCWVRGDLSMYADGLRFLCACTAIVRPSNQATNIRGRRIRVDLADSSKLERLLKTKARTGM